MDAIDKLIKKREFHKNKVSLFDETIKEERRKLAQDRGLADYIKLLEENNRLKGLFSLLANTEGKTYEEIGALLKLEPDAIRTHISHALNEIYMEDE